MLQAMKATRMSYLNTDRENCILNTLSTQLPPLSSLSFKNSVEVGA